MINSKTNKLIIQKLEKIDELIKKLREINDFFNSITENKKNRKIK